MRTLFRAITFGVLLGLTAKAGELKSGEKLWSFTADQGIQSSPASGVDGTIYFGTDGGILFALNRDGSIKWEYKTGGSLASSPAIGPDGTVHVGSSDRVLYALSPEGKLKWLASPGSAMVASPAVASDGTIYVATVFNTVAAFSNQGTRHWVFPTGGNLVSSPVIAPGGAIYIGCRDNRLYALTPEGKLKWTFTTSAPINASPALGADGTIYIGSLDHKLFAVNPDGSKRWEYVTEDAIRSSAAIAADGTIYVGSDDGKLHAVSPVGERKWAFSTGRWFRSSPAVCNDGTVFIGSYDNHVYAVNPDGTVRWRFATGGYLSSSPVIGKDGTVYIGSWDKQLYALKNASLIADSSWPMFRGNAAHTGRIPQQQVAPQLELSLANLIKTFHAPATLRLSADLIGATDPKTKVEFYHGPLRIGEAYSRPYGMVWSNVTAGTYALTAKAIFPSGKTLDSRPLEISVSAPPVPVTPRVTKASRSPKPPSETPDETKPFVAIVSPGLDSQIKTAEIIARGTASDNVEVARVECQLGRGPYTPAQGTDHWEAKLQLAPGDNTLHVRAIDRAGNQSSVAKRKFHYAARLPLQVKVQGEGIIRSSLDDQELEVGKTYSLTAEPRAGMVFAGWTGSLQTNTPTVTFTMAEKFHLQANFLPNRFAAIKGQYTGLIDPPGQANPEVAGIISVATTEKGGYRGQLQLGGASYPLKGQFDPTGTLRQTIDRLRHPSLTLLLRLDLASDPDLITGSLSDGTTTTEILGDRLIYDGREHKAPQAGRYTLTLGTQASNDTAPQGDGFGTLTVDEGGWVHFAGTLNDGTVLKQDVPLSKSGVWPVYIPLYDGRGSLSGWVRFKSETYGDMFGQLTWVKPAPEKGMLHQAGFTNQIAVLGSAYDASGQAFSGGNGILRLKGGGLDELLIAGISLDSNYKVEVPKQNGLNLKLKIAVQTGLFTGSLKHPGTGEVTDFKGVLLQKQNAGSGFFTGSIGAGHVLLRLPAKPAPNTGDR